MMARLQEQAQDALLDHSKDGESCTGSAHQQHNCQSNMLMGTVAATGRERKGRGACGQSLLQNICSHATVVTLARKLHA
jgi:hypothetical protein